MFALLLHTKMELGEKKPSCFDFERMRIFKPAFETSNKTRRGKDSDSML